MQPSPASYAAPFGRFLLSLIFIASAAGKLNEWEGTAKMMADKGLPAVDALLSVVIVLELVGGLLVLLGFYTRWGAVALLVFLVPVTAIMHNFWAYEGAEGMQHMINFMKNISIMGGLLMVFALGPGPMSLDAWLRPVRKVKTLGPIGPIGPFGPA